MIGRGVIHYVCEPKFSTYKAKQTLQTMAEMKTENDMALDLYKSWVKTVPLNPEIKKWTDVYALPPTPEEMAWMEAASHEAQDCTWHEYLLMAIRTKTHVTVDDFPAWVRGNLHPNRIVRSGDGDGPVMMRLGSANFFRKLIQKLSELTAVADLGPQAFGLRVATELDDDDWRTTALILFGDHQLLTRTRAPNQQRWIINRETFFSNLQRFRTMLGIDHDYGFGRQLQAEGLALLQRAKDAGSWTWNTLESLWGGFMGMVGSLGGTVTSTLSDLLTWIKDYFLRAIKAATELVSTEMYQKCLTYLGKCLIAFALACVGFVAWKKVSAFLYTESGAEMDYTAEGPEPEDLEEPTEETWISFFKTWIGRIFDLEHRGLDRLANRAKSVLTLATATGLAGSVAATGLLYAFWMWRDGLQAFNFGSDELEARDWVEKATMLTSLSRNVAVVHSREYREAVVQSVRDGNRLQMSKISPELRNPLMRLFSDVLRISTAIEQMTEGAKKRITPYSIGLWGKPGTGKTNVVEALAKALTGGDVYSRPADDYWNGYANEPVILFDEFMAHPESTHDSEILQLVSPASFMPNMASMDNFAVGNKGTTISPELVIMTSNAQFPKVNVNATAFQRRRNVNIEVSLSPDVKPEWKTDKGSLDMTKLPRQMIKDKSYMRFRFTNRIYRPGKSDELETEFFTFSQVVETLRDAFNAHQETGRFMLECDGVVAADKPASEVMDEVLLKIRSGTALRKPCFADFFNFTAEGRKKKQQKESPEDFERIEILNDHLSEAGEMLNPSDSSDDAEFGSIPDDDPPSVADLIELEQIHLRGICPGLVKNAGMRAWPMVAMLPLLVWGLWTLSKWILGKNGGPEGEALSFEPESKGKRARKRHERKPMILKGGVGEAGKSLDNNVGSVTVGGCTTNCTFLTGNIFVAPYHLFLYENGLCAEGTNFRVITDQNSIDLVFRRAQCNWSPEGDVLFYRVTDPKWKPLRNLRARLITEDSLAEIQACEANFFKQDGPHFVKVTRTAVGRYKYAGKEFAIDQGLLYAINSDIGDCGSFLTVAEGKYTGKIIGMHVAGSTTSATKYGLATPLTREMFDLVTATPDMPETFDGDAEAPEFDNDDVRKHLDSVNSHKDAILKLGLQIPGRPVSWERLRRHDDTKFTRAEIRGYVDRWVRGEETDAWLLARDHHLRNNDHHPQFWEGDMEEPALKESVVDAMACIWERKLGMEKVNIARLCDWSEKDLERYTPSDRRKVKELLAEFAAYNVILDPDFDACSWPVGFRKDPEAVRDIIAGPNLIGVEKATWNNVAPGNSKLRPTIFHGQIGPSKPLAVLSQEDERSRGYDPLYTGAKLLCQNRQVKIPSKVLQRAADRSFNWLKDRIVNQFPRKLTFKQAVEGIPGLLKPIDPDTACGYPLINQRTKPGKRDFLERGDDGILHGTEYLETRVEEFIKDLEGGVERSSIFLAHCKDERVSQKKVDEIRTRIVYCGDMVANIAFRMLFGAALINFNNSGATSPAVIGVNPLSLDHDDMKKYLDEIGDGEYLAGDYRAYDLTYQKPVQRAGYAVLGRLLDHWLGDEFDETAWKMHVKHQTEAQIQFGWSLVSVVAAHFSGLFWTTIMNILTNDINSRMAFNLITDLDYDKHVRSQFHGDDNRHKFSREAISAGVTPKRFAEAMAQIGQTYTSDVKGEALTDSFKPWTSCTFLAAYPVKTEWGWTGALREETLLDAPQWKRSHESEAETVNQMLDLCSQWDEKTYAHYFEKIAEANQGKFHIPSEPYYLRRERQAHRRGIPLFVAEAPPPTEKPIITLESAAAPVTVSTTMVNAEMARLSINASEMGVNEAMEQKVFRKAVTWTDTGLSEPVQIQGPYGFLDLGEQRSMQNRAFDMFIWWQGTMIVDIQLNAQSFLQGTLVAYWRPLATQSLGAAAGLTCHHVIMQPGTTSYQLSIPFIFPRSVTNNFARGEGDGSLGTFLIEVLNPLSAGAQSIPRATVSIFSSFKDSKMTLPLPLTAVPRRRIPAKWVAPPEEPIFQAEGGGSSTVNNTFNVNAGGDVPIELDNSGTSSQGAGVEAALDASIPMPMDKPPLVGGGIPIYQQFSGMAKANGVNPTIGMSLHPQQISRTKPDLWPIGSYELSKIMMRYDRSHVFNWSTNNAVGDKLLEFQIQLGTDLPTLHNYVGGQFQFWKAHPILTFLAAKTRFHTGKLRVSVGYGVPGTVTFDESSNYKSRVMDFDADTNRRELKIPYNAQTPVLKTYSGTKVADPVQDHVLATVAIFVQNELVAPETVAQEIEVNLIQQYDGAELYVPRPFSFVTGDVPRNNLYNVDPPNKKDELSFSAEAPDKDGLETTEEEGIADPPQAEPLTNVEMEEKQTKPCKLDLGGHMEYNPKTVCELGRRYAEMSIGRDYMTGVGQFIETQDPGVPVLFDMIAIQVRPIHPMVTLFAGWRGSLNFRIFLTSNFNPGVARVAFVPTNENHQTGMTSFNPLGIEGIFSQGAANTTWNALDGDRSYFSNRRSTETPYPAVEAMYPLTLGENYIDVMVPFQSIYNFLPIQEFSAQERLAVASGQLYVFAPSGVRARVYCAFADDLVMGGFAGNIFRSTDYTISATGVIPFGLNV